ncbi:MAG: DUF1178 family protein [Casimicrobiaceae bacterium]
MIVFDLCCASGHSFEGWFDSAIAYADQRARGMVRCPVCDDASIDKRLTARISTHKASQPAKAIAAPAPTAHDAAAGLPAEVLAKLREIVRNTENVGERFAEEARKIHYDEVPARAIRGQATADEADALREEGIDFASLPPSITTDTH